MDPCRRDQKISLDGELSGNITSKNYPLPYGNDLDCRWHIHVDNGHIIHLTFPEFDVEE